MSQRKFLVIADDSPEFEAALHFACRRARSTRGHVALLRVIEPAVFEHWSGVREEIERQARQEAEAVLQKLAEYVVAETGLAPEFIIKHADNTRAALRAVISEDAQIKILVLAAAVGGRGPGPLVASLAKEGVDWGARKLPVTVVPGDLTDEEIATWRDNASQGRALASRLRGRHIWGMFIQTEFTPNPEVLKFLPGRDVYPDGTRDFRDAEDAAVSPLAAELFEIDGVERVYFGGDFITVGKRTGLDWTLLKAPILAAIQDHFTAGRPLFLQAQADDGGHDDTVYEGDAAQIVAEIKDLLDTRIRPAVAQDGGDILFNRFEPDSGVVYLHMKGACSGCPSSSATLKAGVENMLKHYVPEVTRVEQTL